MRRSAIVILCCVLGAAACNPDADEPSTTTTAADTSTTTAATTTQAPTTTAPAATTTTEPVGGWYVVDVAADDVLNVREGPGVDYAVVDTFAPDAAGITLTGNVARIGLVVWVEAEIPGGSGWSVLRYLQAVDPSDRDAILDELTEGAAFDDAGVYRVAGVAADDVLNVREGPGTGYTVAADLAPEASGVWSNGDVARIDGATWAGLASPAVGWVHSGFLAPVSGVAAADPCDPAADHPGVPAAGGGPGGATTVSGLEWAAHGSGADYCERFVLDLIGGDLGDVTVTGDTDFLHIALPGVTMVEADATELLPGATLVHSAYTVRTAGPDRDLYVNVHLNADVQVWVHLLTAPAQVVIDLVPGAAPPGSIRRPVTDGILVLSRQLAPPVTARDYPVGVLGYGRPFESYLDVAVTSGSGDPVIIQWPDGTESENGGQAQTTDWTDTWGEFRFTIVAGPSGDVITVRVADDMTESVVVDAFPVN